MTRKPRSRSFRRLCLVAVAVDADCRALPPVEAARPPAAKLLPENTIAMLSIADVRDLVARFQNTATGKMSQDPQLKPFIQRVYGGGERSDGRGEGPDRALAAGTAGLAPGRVDRGPGRARGSTPRGGRPPGRRRPDEFREKSDRSGDRGPGQERLQEDRGDDRRHEAGRLRHQRGRNTPGGLLREGQHGLLQLESRDHQGDAGGLEREAGPNARGQRPLRHDRQPVSRRGGSAAADHGLRRPGCVSQKHVHGESAAWP